MDAQQKYFLQLEVLVRKLRAAQLEADKYRAKSFYERVRYLGRQVDKLMSEEETRRKQLQLEIKYDE